MKGRCGGSTWAPRARRSSDDQADYCDGAVVLGIRAFRIERATEEDPYDPERHPLIRDLETLLDLV